MKLIRVDIMKGKQNQKRGKDREDLRHEGEGHFLDLRQRLEERDDEADRQTDQHDGSRNAEEHQDGVTGDIENIRRSHGWPAKWAS